MGTTSLMHRAKRGRDYPIRLSLSVSSNLMELWLIPSYDPYSKISRDIETLPRHLTSWTKDLSNPTLIQRLMASKISKMSVYRNVGRKNEKFFVCAQIAFPKNKKKEEDKKKNSLKFVRCRNWLETPSKFVATTPTTNWWNANHEQQNGIRVFNWQGT